MDLRSAVAFFSRSDSFFFFCVFSRHDFYDEVESLWKIRDPNIARVLGCCLSEEPFCLVTEFMQYGDLNQFLQEHVALTAAPVPPYAKTLRLVALHTAANVKTM